MPNFYYCDQYSDEYWDLHTGVPTTSQFSRIITGEGNPSESFRGYMYELIAERLLREAVKKDELKDQYWIKRGKQKEPEARTAFQKKTKLYIELVGFVTENCAQPGGQEDTIYKVGSSPDFVVPLRDKRPKIGGEIKVPAPWTHIGYMLDGPDSANYRKTYKQQVQGQLFVCGLEKIYFVSYHPQMPLYIIETGRDDKYIEKMQKCLTDFCEELARKLVDARKMGDFIVTPKSVQPIREG